MDEGNEISFGMFGDQVCTIFGKRILWVRSKGGLGAKNGLPTFLDHVKYEWVQVFVVVCNTSNQISVDQHGLGFACLANINPCLTL